MSFLNDTTNRTQKKNEILNELRNIRREDYIDELKEKYENEDSDDDFDIPEELYLVKRYYETSNPYIKKCIDQGHDLKGRKLLFSYDVKPIPYLDYDDKNRLIDGSTCYDESYKEKETTRE